MLSSVALLFGLLVCTADAKNVTKYYNRNGSSEKLLYIKNVNKY
jgi:hypothetical protein